MAKERILVVEDEETIFELVRHSLTKEGFLVIGVGTGEEGLKAVRAKNCDLVLLDLLLPGMGGLEVCRLIKADPKTRHLPVIMLTGKGEDVDVVTGLELGADDYITKPFSPRVLTARVRAVLRKLGKSPGDGEAPLAIHGFAINPGRHEVLLNGRPVNLTFTEFRVLYLLASRPGWVFTRYQIVDGIRGNDYPVTERSVDVQVVGLRKKLRENRRFIETVRGVGYRFKEE